MDENYITFEYKGLTCKYHKDALKHPQTMKMVAEELGAFVAFFSDPAPEAGVSWSDVHDDIDRDVFNFFQGMYHISNEWVDMVDEILSLESNEGTTFEQACKRATESLDDEDDEQ